MTSCKAIQRVPLSSTPTAIDHYDFLLVLPFNYVHTLYRFQFITSGQQRPS